MADYPWADDAWAPDAWTDDAWGLAIERNAEALQDAILVATGGPTVTAGLMSWFGGVGTLQERERDWLLANGGISGTNTEMWMQGPLAGIPGDFSDRYLRYWQTA